MIAYIDSPFQLLQCSEFEHNIKRLSQVYIRLNGKPENDKQLACLSDYLKFKNIKLIKIESLLERMGYYIFFIIRTFFAEKVLVGDSNSFIFKILSLIYRNDKFILLDDGVATINDTEKNLKFKRFTIFPECVRESLVNDFKYIKSLIEHHNYRKMHVIIGGKFVDEGICSKLVYAHAIRCIIDNLDCSVDILYVPHRGETEEHLQWLKEQFFFQIMRTSYPIELLSIEKNIYPATISSVLSTAVYSMALIYENIPIYTYRIDDDDITSRKNGVLNIYAQLCDKGVSKFIH